MAWFGRKGKDAEPVAVEEPPNPFEATLADVESDDGKPLRPVVEPIGEAERARIAAALEALAAEGVDVGDLASVGAGFDRAYAAWSAAPERDRPDHAAIVERYAVAIGEHLQRATDLDWQIVTDVFGTDLSVAGGMRGDFVVVPHNLVAGRWMRGETGWIPRVTGHIVTRRSRR